MAGKGDLHRAFEGGTIVAQRQAWRAKAVAPKQPRFDALSFGRHDDQRPDAVIGEIGKVDGIFFSTLLVPGDICDIDGLLVQTYDYGVVALTPCTVVTIAHADLLALCERMPAIARALTWFGFVDNAMLIEAATSLARRTAIQRLAYLLCELMLRLEAVGSARPDGFTLPLSQENLGEALGMTGVHMNRSIKA